MSYTVGRVKDETLNLMREKSNGGDVDTGDNVQDYFLSIPSLINTYQKSIAMNSSKIRKNFDIAHNMPDNQLGTLRWNDNNVHQTDDVIFEALGSQAYSFQVAGVATVYIEEETATDVWTILDTIAHSSSAGDGYVTYNSLTDVTDITNNIRIRFSGPYRYPLRWVALFADLFPTDDDVPKYEPYVPYEMPTDFFLKNRVTWTHDYIVWEDYSNYKFEIESGSTKVVSFYWYDKGEFRINYYAYPAMVPDLDPDDPDYPDEQDDFIIDIPDESCTAMVMFIASALKVDEDQDISVNLLNNAYIEMNNLEANDTSEQYATKVININNW